MKLKHISDQERARQREKGGGWRGECPTDIAGIFQARRDWGCKPPAKNRMVEGVALTPRPTYRPLCSALYIPVGCVIGRHSRNVESGFRGREVANERQDSLDGRSLADSQRCSVSLSARLQVTRFTLGIKLYADRHSLFVPIRRVFRSYRFWPLWIPDKINKPEDGRLKKKLRADLGTKDTDIMCTETSSYK